MEYEEPIFTRYLYEYHQVKYSLLFAILAKSREEAIFWAYELYHSGFEEDVWYWVRDIYVDYYEETNPKFKNNCLDKLYLQWQESGNALLIGTVVGTLAMRDRFSENVERFFILYKEDRHQTLAVIGKPRHYLKQVSQYPIRSEIKDLTKDVLGVSLQEIREAYLGVNWLYYCASTPIWETRIREGKGISDSPSKLPSYENHSIPTLILRSGIVHNHNHRIEFESDDLLEAFYERWGFEPDEQCAEIHLWHGVYNFNQ